MSIAPSLLEKMEAALREARLIIEEKDAEIANLREQLGGQAKERMLDRLGRFGLTMQEATLFAVLYDAKGRTLSKYDLEERLPSQDRSKDRVLKIVEVTVCHVRRKLGDPELIETVWGRGYRLSKSGLALGNRISNDEPVQITPRPVGNEKSKLRLSEDQVREVRAIGSNEPARILAHRFGCSLDVIYAIRKGDRYHGVGLRVGGGRRMISPALIAEEIETQTYTQVALKYGITRGAVAGIVHRARGKRPRRPRTWNGIAPPAQDGFVQRAVLVLLADGRERTTPEIADRTGHSLNSVSSALHRLRAAGLVIQAETARGGLPSIWQEAPE